MRRLLDFDAAAAGELQIVRSSTLDEFSLKLYSRSCMRKLSEASPKSHFREAIIQKVNNFNENEEVRAHIYCREGALPPNEL